jgi:hypothetical protein
MKSDALALAALILGAAAAPSLATCADTLYLQRMLRTETLYRIQGTSVDSSTTSRIIPLDSLVLAAPPTIPAGLTSTDTARTLLSFVPDCGSDSVTTAMTFRAVDTFVTDLKNNVTRTPAGSLQSLPFRTVTTSDAGRILPSGDTIYFQAAWTLTPSGDTAVRFETVVPSGDDTIRGATTGGTAWLYKSGKVSISSYPMQDAFPGKGVASNLSTFRSGFLSQASGSSYDSAVVRLVSLQNVYDTGAHSYAAQGATGIASRQVQSKVGIAAVAGGWKVTSTLAGEGFVYRFDGRLLRRFPVGSSFVWDGRDACGQSVGHGVVLVGFQGQGASVLALP